MYSGLVHAHSGLRWVVFALLVAAIIQSWQQAQAGKSTASKPSKVVLFALISCHIQLLLGLALYFISPKVRFDGGVMADKIARFYTVEHISVMLLALVLITLGYSQGKRLLPAVAGHRKIFNYYLIGLVLILVSIPWPFRQLGAGWF